MARRHLLGLVSVLAGLSPALCAAQTAGDDCTRLRDPIPAASIGLPSAGATIDAAESVAPSPLTPAALPFGPLPPYLAVVPAAPGAPLQAFALNDEALTNFAYASYKKVRDVAVALMQRRYGRAPAKLYFVGFSEGGREGLTMAQRFPADYDGIFSGVPVINWVG